MVDNEITSLEETKYDEIFWKHPVLLEPENEDNAKLTRKM